MPKTTYVIQLGIFCFFFTLLSSVGAQEYTLDYFLAKAEANAATLKENNNLLKIGEIQNSIIEAQNKGFKVDATSEVLVAPFFNSNGRAVEITTNPSSNAYGYDAAVTNGGLYSAQMNITKNLFNKSATDNLLFQNKLKNDAISLSSEDILHHIMAYQYQLQEDFTKELKADLEKRLQVTEVLVKRGILSQSDYLLIKTDIDAKNLELQQLEINRSYALAQLYNLCGLSLSNDKDLDTPLVALNNKRDSYFYEKKLHL